MANPAVLRRTLAEFNRHLNTYIDKYLRLCVRTVLARKSKSKHYRHTLEPQNVLLKSSHVWAVVWCNSCLVLKQNRSFNFPMFWHFGANFGCFCHWGSHFGRLDIYKALSHITLNKYWFKDTDIVKKNQYIVISSRYISTTVDLLVIFSANFDQFNKYPEHALFGHTGGVRFIWPLNCTILLFSDRLLNILLAM